VLEAIDFGVQHRAGLLDAAVVPASHDLVIDHQSRANRNAAFGESLPCLVDRRREKCIHHETKSTSLDTVIDAAYLSTLVPRIPPTPPESPQ